MSEAGQADRRILIAGAGVAGLSAAIALRLQGFEPVVLEREARLEAIGAGLQLGPNATCLLAAWGVSLEGRACEPFELRFHAMRSGRRLNALPLGGEARGRYGSPYLTALRAHLQEALLARATALGVEIRYASPVLAVAEDGAGVSVALENEVLRGLALIAADGLRSALREAVALRSRPLPTGAVAWRATLPLRAAPVTFRDDAIGLWMGSGAHLVHYPVDGGALVNAVLVVEDGWRGSAGSESTLGARLRDWAADVRALVEGAGSWRPWPIETVPPLGSWHRGRLCLIGDAAHAMAPYLASGAVMAMEDAAALARAFAETHGEASGAYARFEAMRRARVVRVADRSGLMGRIYHFPEPGALVRNAVIARTPPAALLARNDWLYAWRAEPADGKA